MEGEYTSEKREKILVIVNVANKSVRFNVGNGHQTFRWLAGVIVDRLKETKLVREEYADNNFVISSLQNENGILLNPKEHIFEHIPSDSKNTISIKATLSPNFPSDEWGNPILTPWQVNAFVHSESGFRWATETDAWRERMAGQEEEDESKKAEISISPRMRSSLVQIGEDFNGADLDTAFQLDWKHVKCSWMAESPSVISTITSLGDVLRPRYAVVCNIFAHYCGVGEGT